MGGGKRNHILDYLNATTDVAIMGFHFYIFGFQLQQLLQRIQRWLHVKNAGQGQENKTKVQKREVARILLAKTK